MPDPAGVTPPSAGGSDDGGCLRWLLGSLFILIVLFLGAVAIAALPGLRGRGAAVNGPEATLFPSASIRPSPTAGPPPTARPSPLPTMRPTPSPPDRPSPTPSPTAAASTATPSSTAAVPTPAPTVASTPVPSSPAPTVMPSPPVPPPPVERTEFVAFLVELGVLQPAYGAVPLDGAIEAATIRDEAGDLFRHDGRRVDVVDAPDLAAGFVVVAPELTPAGRAALFARCDVLQPPFHQTCGDRRGGSGPVNVIWIGTREPLGEGTGGPFLIADHDADRANNPRPTDELPLHPSQAGDAAYVWVTNRAGNLVVKRFDFEQPGEVLRTDAIQFVGPRSLAWIVFGEHARFSPGIQKVEDDTDMSVDVLGRRPVADKPFPAHPPYDVTQPCSAGCEP